MAAVVVLAAVVAAAALVEAAEVAETGMGAVLAVAMVEVAAEEAVAAEEEEDLQGPGTGPVKSPAVVTTTLPGGTPATNAALLRVEGAVVVVLEVAEVVGAVVVVVVDMAGTEMEEEDMAVVVETAEEL